MEKIEYLLYKYQGIFPTKFSEMKGISRELREMVIHLQLGAKPVRHRHYRLNLKYKEKVKA